MGVLFDHGTRGFHVEAYVDDNQFEAIRSQGISVARIPDEATIYGTRLKESTRGTPNPLNEYHNYEELTAFLEQIASDYSEITELTSIGQSVDGRELWAVKITDNPGVEETEPEFKYIANMHGNETPGREFCLYLIEWLVANYGSIPRATNIVDRGEIWIIPSMNPDGFERVQRWNTNGVDLNRDFPDRLTDPVNLTEGRQPETAAVMNFSGDHTFIHSANMHTGALVANYPYDSYPNITPDNDLFVQMSLSYAGNNRPMYESSSFRHGITNGADWYQVFGGMQDWNYVWMGDFEVTIEHHDTKWPPASWLAQGWEENRESLLTYLEWIFQGVSGIVVRETSGGPLLATATINDNDHEVYSDPQVGDFHRILLPGTYEVTVSAPGYYPVTLQDVAVVEGELTDLDTIALFPLPQEPILRISSHSAGFVAPGDTIHLNVSLSNTGPVSAQNVEGILSTSDSQVTLQDNSASFGTILPETETRSETPFTFIVSPSVPVGHTVFFNLEVSGAGYLDNFSLPLIVGEIEILVWDPDGNHNSGPAFAESLTRLGVSVDYLGIGNPPADLSGYAGVFVCLGTSPDQAVLSEPDANRLILTLDNGGFAYMEGGDTWYYDSATSFHSRFGIEGISGGISGPELSLVVGQSDLFEDLSFSYQGDNRWIDHIAPSSENIWLNRVIWKNDNPSFGVGVASSPTDGLWRTVGTSFEFGGIPPALQDSVMLRYLRYSDLEPLKGVECVKGDLSSDGNLQVDDVLILVDFLLDRRTPDYVEFCVSDLNRDSRIDVFDIVLLVDLILNAESPVTF